MGPVLSLLIALTAPPPVDCATTEGCVDLGYCRPWKGQCVISKAGCRQSRACRRDGACSLVEDECRAVTPADCRRLDVCAKRGCVVVGGSCRPNPTGGLNTGGPGVQFVQAKGRELTLYALVGATLLPRGAVTFPNDVLSVAFTPDRSAVVLTEGHMAWRLGPKRAHQLKLPPPTVFRSPKCRNLRGRALEDCLMEWEPTRPPTWRAHLFPTARGLWLGDCSNTGGEAGSACVEWRFAPLSGGRARTKPPKATYEHVLPLQLTPYVDYHPPITSAPAAGLSVRGVKPEHTLLVCQDGGRTVEVAALCWTADEGGGCPSLERVVWRGPGLYVAETDLDVSGEFPSIHRLLLRACHPEPIARFRNSTDGPDGVWIHDDVGGYGVPTVWTIRRGDVPIATLTGGAIPLFLPK